jgi:hypothetical protein
MNEECGLEEPKPSLDGNNDNKIQSKSNKSVKKRNVSANGGDDATITSPTPSKIRKTSKTVSIETRKSNKNLPDATATPSDSQPIKRVTRSCRKKIFDL